MFKSVKIVKDNVFMEKDIVDAFNYPSVYPGCSGSRFKNYFLSKFNLIIINNSY